MFITRQRYDKWYNQQSRVRLTVFYGGFVASVVMFGALAWMLSHPPHKLTLNECIAFGLCELSFFILWPLITLRWKSAGKLA
jgi:hypothetical protein